ncbi:MAG: esterase-like activity of phytase family protein [Rhodospirillales bacterium]
MHRPLPLAPSRRRRFAFILALAVFALLGACRGLPAEELRQEITQEITIEVTARPVPLNSQDESIRSVGKLRYRGGLALSAAEPHFGGLSGLIVSPDGATFDAISDMGYRLSGTLGYDSSGDLASIGKVRMGPLLAPDGTPTVGKLRGDAESIAPDNRGGYFIGFEQDHRLWRYPSLTVRPSQVEAPGELAKAPANGGLEALARLGDGRTLALTEQLAVRGGTRGWLGRPGYWKPLTLAADGGFAATAAATLPDGDVLVLQRRFPPVGARVVRIDAAAIRPGATLEGEELARLEGTDTVDNMEGIDARKGANGETLLYLLSDDNFSPLQQTLLMMFELEP